MKIATTSAAAIATVLCVLVGPVHARELGVVVFDVESTPAASAAAILRAVPPMQVYGFTAVSPKAATSLVGAVESSAAGRRYQSALGKSGGSHRVLLAWSAADLRLARSYELDSFAAARGSVAPLVAELVVGEHDAPVTVVLAHLAAKDAESRRREASMLNGWAATRTEPVIVLAELDGAWNVGDGSHDRAYDALTAADTLQWIRPPELVATKCGPGDALTTFVCTAGAARSWPAAAEILFRDDDFCGTQRDRGYRRPVRAVMSLPSGPRASQPSEHGGGTLEERIERLEREHELTPAR